MRLIEGILDSFAGVESHGFGGGDLYRLSALWIASLACRPCGYIESAEARDTHRFSSHEGIENSVYDGLHRLSCRPLV